MDITSITSIIGSLGFPIVACCGMAWFIKYQTDTHKAEQDKLTEALNNNTMALQKLCDRMGVDSGKD